MAEKTMVEAVRDAMFEEMKRDERIILMGEDVGEGGVFRATEGFVAEFGEDRCMDTPLAESCIVGAAIGASLNGIIPIAEIQFADFSHPAFDQIVSEAARLHYRSNGTWSCPIVDPHAVWRRASTAARTIRRASRRSTRTCRGSRSSALRTPTTRRGSSSPPSATRTP